MAESVKKVKKKKSSLFPYLGKEKLWIVPGLIVAAANGSITPLFGLCLAKVLAILGDFYLYDDKNFKGPPSKDDILWSSDKYVIGFFGLSVAIFIFNTLQLAIFNYIGQKFTLTIRKVYFRRLLYKDMDYFDQKGNEPGSISDRLQNDC